MKIPRSDRNHAGTFDSALTPMIDVVFLLLIFFVWNANFQPQERLLASRVTTPSGGDAVAPGDLKQEDFEKVIVRLTVKDGRVLRLLNQHPLASQQELRDRLKQVMRIRADLPLLVDPDEDVPLGSVIEVYDLACLTGWTNIQFTARR